MRIIPTLAGEDKYSFVREYTLEGTAYRFDFRWLDRHGWWYLDLFTPGGTELATGIKLVPGRPLLRTRRSNAVPPGELILVRADPEVSDVYARLSLGDSYDLYYFTEAEVEEQRLLAQDDQETLSIV